MTSKPTQTFPFLYAFIVGFATARQLNSCKRGEIIKKLVNRDVSYPIETNSVGKNNAHVYQIKYLSLKS